MDADVVGRASFDDEDDYLVDEALVCRSRSKDADVLVKAEMCIVLCKHRAWNCTSFDFADFLRDIDYIVALYITHVAT